MQLICRFLSQRADLATLERAPFSPGVEQGPRPRDRRSACERLVAREGAGPPEPDGPFERLARAIRAYEVFPTTLLSGLLRRPVEVGDTFASCYHFLPGLDLFFGGRVTETFDGRQGDAYRAGFTFRTVAGHPLIGEETFFVVKDGASGEVRAGLSSWSRNAGWLARLGAPFVRWVQKRAVRGALDRLQRVARKGRGPSHEVYPSRAGRR